MSKDKNNVVNRLRDKIKPENRIFVKKNLAISEQVEMLRKEKGWSQKELAQQLGKTESEVSRILSGLHNITLKSIAKLETVLGSDIIVTPVQACEKIEPNLLLEKQIDYLSPEGFQYRTLGNTELLKHFKTAFLCSRKVPAGIILKSYDWAKQQRDSGNCIICSYHSPIEKDVFEILLRGKQPLILVLPRALKKRWEPEIQEAVQANRLLIISRFDTTFTRITRETAQIKNETIIELSDEIIAGYVEKGGQLKELLKYKKFKTLL